MICYRMYVLMYCTSLLEESPVFRMESFKYFPVTIPSPELSNTRKASFCDEQETIKVNILLESYLEHPLALRLHQLPLHPVHELLQLLLHLCRWLHTASFLTRAVKRSIGFTIGFNDHREGPIWLLRRSQFHSYLPWGGVNAHLA